MALRIRSRLHIGYPNELAKRRQEAMMRPQRQQTHRPIDTRQIYIRQRDPPRPGFYIIHSWIHSTEIGLSSLGSITTRQEAMMRPQLGNRATGMRS